jgi:hypothetical protein
MAMNSHFSLSGRLRVDMHSQRTTGNSDAGSERISRELPVDRAETDRHKMYIMAASASSQPPRTC